MLYPPAVYVLQVIGMSKSNFTGRANSELLSVPGKHRQQWQDILFSCMHCCDERLWVLINFLEELAAGICCDWTALLPQLFCESLCRDWVKILYLFDIINNHQFYDVFSVNFDFFEECSNIQKRVHCGRGEYNRREWSCSSWFESPIWFGLASWFWKSSVCVSLFQLLVKFQVSYCRCRRGNLPATLRTCFKLHKFIVVRQNYHTHCGVYYCGPQ